MPHAQGWSRHLLGEVSSSATQYWVRQLLESTDARGHEHKGKGPGGGQFTGTGGGSGGSTTTARGTSKPGSSGTAGRATKPKHLRAAYAYRDVARRRRVVAAVKVEGELADGIRGFNLPDSEPADVVYCEDAMGRPVRGRQQVKDFLDRRQTAVQVLRDRNASPPQREAAERVLSLPCHFVEVKTLLSSWTSAVHLSKAARKRKERWESKYGASFSVVAVDRRRGKKHSGHEVHVAAGELAGTFRLDRMDKADSFEAVLSKLCPECGSRAN